jgi:hypothetical protein
MKIRKNQLQIFGSFIKHLEQDFSSLYRLKAETGGVAITIQ